MKLESAIGIFFRVPHFGKVKKRLANDTGKHFALKAYKSMLKETFENVSGLKGIDIYGFYDGELSSENCLLNSDNASIDPFKKGVPLIPQKGNNLGERMYNAIQLLLNTGYQKVSLIGADSPDLPVSFIDMAFRKLDLYDLVIGPTEDGGYYLIGMKKPLDEIFKSIQWGQDTVLKDTISNALNLGISYFLLPEWYDIDEIDNLKRWRLNRRKSVSQQR
ncbi:MAG: TIGR04282 family arsenosugar biosynthesis glycosyltransferase [Thermodesulfovibrionales bacterium]